MVLRYNATPEKKGYRASLPLNSAMTLSRTEYHMRKSLHLARFQLETCRLGDHAAETSKLVHTSVCWEGVGAAQALA